MNTERILVANLKCNGCASTVRKELMNLVGMKTVEVNLQEDAVDVSYEDLQRDTIIRKLHSLGYPEATEANGILLQLKSFASCMIGRADNLVHHKN